MAEKENKLSANLKKLRIHNFKKFDDVTIRFSPGLNILVGVNNAGKTTILEALDIIMGERNISPLSLGRATFNSFDPDKLNKAVLVLEVEYPNSGTAKKEINIVKQLKVGKRSSRSQQPMYRLDGHKTIEEIMTGIDTTDVPFEHNTIKSGYDIENIFLVTELAVNEDQEAEVSYSIYMNVVVNVDGNNSKQCWQMVGITGAQRASLYNYLFIPANRIGNKGLFEISDFNWLGRYLKGYTKTNNKEELVEDTAKQFEYPNIIDPNIPKIFKEVFSKNVDLNLNLINKEDTASLIKNSKIYVSDGFNDEAISKGQGVQSAVAIALFAGWSQYRANQAIKNKNVNYCWNTLLTIEEPESHFQFPLKQRLMGVLKKEFISKGSQILISTHDDGFISWDYMGGANVILTDVVEDNTIKSINLVDETDIHFKRFLRFNSKTLFTDKVVVVEGNEAVCIDALSQCYSDVSLKSEGILATTCVGGERSSEDDKQHLKTHGGKDDVDDNIKYFQQIGKNVVCIVDCDVLADNGKTVKNIYKQISGEDLNFDFSTLPYITVDETSLSKLRSWWNSNKDDTQLLKLINSLENSGIFLFPGDFESLFTEDYLQNFMGKDKDENTILIKEKHTTDVKYILDTEGAIGIKEYISQEGKEFLESIGTKLKDYFEKPKLYEEPNSKEVETGSESLEDDGKIPF